jgi:metal-sulfur cluster biosynthetic enzyme
MCFASLACAQRAVGVEAASEEERDPVDALEIFEHLRDIKDPEHPHSLEELNVMQEKNIQVDDAKGLVK